MKGLLFANGYGGFDPKNGDYVITNPLTPSPWCNIITNSQFGTIISQSGASHTWFGNSSLFRISPKIDDPVLESTGEKLFLKDEVAGDIWQPMASASRVRHSFGHSIFSGKKAGVESKVTVFVARNKPLKVIKVRIRNLTDRQIKYSATYYIQPVLGDIADHTKADLLLNYNHPDRLIYIKNPGSAHYPEALVYFGSSEKNVSYTLDRTSFLGRTRSLIPEGLKDGKLSIGTEKTAAPSSLIKSPSYFRIFIESARSLYATPMDGLITFFLLLSIIFVAFKIIRR